MPAQPPLDLFDRIYSRHGHRCPMSTLGGRLGWAGVQALGTVDRLRAVYFIGTCALDGIRETTGCLESEGTLRVDNRGEHRLRLEAGKSEVEVVLTPAALEVAGRYRLCSEALERDRPRLSAEDLALRERERDQVLQSVLEKLWSLPDAVLLSVRTRVPEEMGRA